MVRTPHRTRQNLKKNETYVQELSNGQVLTTIPREFKDWKKARSGSKLRWSDAGGNRIIVEVLPAS